MLKLSYFELQKLVEENKIEVERYFFIYEQTKNDDSKAITNSYCFNLLKKYRRRYRYYSSLLFNLVKNNWL